MGIYVVEHGPVDAPVTALIHGTMDRSASFARAARRLSDLRVVTYDRRGYGRSTEAKAGPLASHVEDLATVLDGRRAVVIGHSFGGDVAFAFAIAHPKMVSAVGAYEPPMPWVGWWPTGGASTAISRRGFDDPGDVAEHFLRSVAGDAVWEGLPERTKALRRAEGPAVLADVTSLTTGPPPFTIEHLATLRRSGTPMLLASGGQSKPHQRNGTTRLGAEIGAPVTVFTDARHGGHSSHPNAFADWVRTIVAAARLQGVN